MKKIITLAIAIGALSLTAQTSEAGCHGKGFKSLIVHHHVKHYRVKVKIGCHWKTVYCGTSYCKAKAIARHYSCKGYRVYISS